MVAVMGAIDAPASVRPKGKREQETIRIGASH